MPVGPLEIAIILVILLVIFGPRLLPSAGRMLGSVVHDAREAVSGIRKDFDKEQNESRAELEPANPEPVERSGPGRDGERS